MRRCSRAFVFLAVVLGVFCAPLSGASAASLSEDDYFTLRDLKKTEVSLGDLLKTHKAVLVNFWATWCPPCREEIPDLIRLQDKYKDEGFTVVGVDVGESSRKVSSFVKRSRINYPVVLDTDHEVTRRYRVVGIPTSLLIASDGTILGEYHAAGADLFAAVDKAVRQ